MTACFDDPGGNTLSFKVWSSDQSVVAVTGSGASVTVTAVRPGNAVVTILADNSYGLKAQQSMSVLVPNRPPLAIGEIENREVAVGDSATVDVAGYFNEPDGQGLTYTAAADSSVLSASIEGSVLTVVATAKGTATITLTATDPGGMKAVQSFLVMVPNRPPLAEGSVPEQTIEVADSAMVDMSPFFNDPDGDALSYAVVASDTLIAAARVAESMITVDAVAKGEATVTVTATDTEGLTAAQSFAVMVPNQPPLAEGSVPEQTIEVADSATVDISPFFDDPDGDALSYAAVASDTLVAAARVVESMITVAAIAKGEAMVTVTATDTERLTAVQAFLVMVPNQPPLAVESIPAQVVEAGNTEDLDMTPLFTDPDGDALTYTAVSADRGVAWVSVVENSISILAIAKGETTITVTATDTEGLAIAQDFVVTVPNQTPLAVGSIPAQSVQVDSVVRVNATPYFSDPDGDSLAYAAETSDPAVATATATGAAVVVTAVSRGKATVTVTVTDTEGLVATQVFTVTVPNRPPLAVESIPAQVVEVGNTGDLDMTPLFSDPDGDALTYTAVSADRGVAWVSVVENSISILAIAKGETTITVTATDTEGLAITQDFVVTVPNQTPLAVGSIPAQSAQVDSEFRVDATPYFSDPDGDPLVYAAATSDPTVATATASGAAVVVTAVSKGEATVTVTVTDTEGLVATQAFAVTVPNRTPLATGSIEAQRFEERETETLDLSPHFSDPDGDPLIFEAMSSAERVVTATVTGGELKLTGRRPGTATITITARDTDGLIATLSFEVRVTRSEPNEPPLVTDDLSSPSIPPGEQFSTDLDDHFDDPDDDPLTFGATSSNERVVTADISGQLLMLTAGDEGTANVGVTATDPQGQSASMQFRVVVERSGGGNQAPAVTARIPNQHVTPAGSFSADLRDHFSDPDRETLGFEAESANENIATAAVSGFTLAVTGVANGTTSITVTASDPGNRSATLSFSVTVEARSSGNQRPTVSNVISFVELDPDDTFETDLDGHFSDPDNDDLTYGAASSDGSVATAGVSGSDLTVTAVAAGTATISVSAEDPGGLSTGTSFDVTVNAPPPPNRAPTVKQSPPDRDLIRNTALPVQGWRYFEDPDGDDLTYTGSSSNSAVASIDQRSDIYFEVYTRSDGNATITITAADPGGLTNSTAFTVTVGNNAPTVKSQVSALTSSPGQVDTLTLNGHFEDSDEGDELSLSTSSSNTDVVTTSTRFSALYGYYASIQGVAVGQATVTLTATDQGGLSVSQSFTVTVGSNRPPTVDSDFGFNLDLKVGETLSYVLSDYFSDPDGDALTYSAQVGVFASVAVAGDTLHVTGESAGISPGTVTATDTGGKSVSFTFLVYVRPASSSQDLDFGATFSSTPGAAMRGGTHAVVAAARRRRRRDRRGSRIVNLTRRPGVAG